MSGRGSFLGGPPAFLRLAQVYQLGNLLMMQGACQLVERPPPAPPSPLNH